MESNSIKLCPVNRKVVFVQKGIQWITGNTVHVLANIQQQCKFVAAGICVVSVLHGW